MIAIPVDEDLSQIQWTGRDYQTRRNLYKQAHVFLTANEKLQHGHWPKVKKKVELESLDQ